MPAALDTAIPDARTLRVVQRARPGRWVATALVLLLLALTVRAFWFGQIEWKVVGEYLAAPTVLAGLVNTLVMTACAMALGLLLGVVAALMVMSPNPVMVGVARFYIWFFRGTPLLLQLLLWFNLALIFPRIGIEGVWQVRTVDVITPFVATWLGLGINQGAYTAEVVRSGILSVDRGQSEAAQAVGMTRLQAMLRIVLPQALRVIVPPVGNEVVSMVKLTSVASVIQFSEILRASQTIYYANARVIELLIVAAVWYLAAVTVLSLLQAVLERRLARGAASAGQRA